MSVSNVSVCDPKQKNNKQCLSSLLEEYRPFIVGFTESPIADLISYCPGPGFTSILGDAVFGLKENFALSPIVDGKS